MAVNPSEAVYSSIQAYVDGELIPIWDYDSFRYKYNIDEPDVCSFVVRSSDISLVDAKHLQEKVELRVIWGYAGGAISKTRKVYIQDLSYEYNDYGVEISIKAYDKSHTLQSNKSKKVIKNKTIDEIAQDIADTNNIKYSPLPFQVDGEEEATVYGFLDTNGTREGFTYENPEGFKMQVPAIENTAVHQFAIFEKKIPFYAQSNNTDKYVLDDLLNQAGGGPYVTETRDDTLAIVKKNFGAKPIKTYAYKGEDGHLLDFKPETKNKTQGAKSTKVTTGVWDEENKEFFESTATESTDDNTRLGEVVELPPDEQTAQLINDGVIDADNEFAAQDIELQNAVPKKISTATDSFKYDTGDGIYNYIPAIDNTSVQLQTFKFYNPIEYGDYIAGKPVDEENTDKIPPEANNQRTNNALDKNPATATILGEPDIECNQVITIINLGKKHSGNYFIESSEHIIDSSYTVSLTLKRNATGKSEAEGDAEVDVSTLNKTLNSQVGPNEAEQINDKVPVVNAEDY